MAVPMVQVQGLEKRRSQNESVFTLQVPEFQVRAGQLIAVTGESGCGKSTLLDLLALVMKPSHVERFVLEGDSGGSVDVGALWERGDERSLAALRSSRLGYVLQTGGLLPFLTVRRNILLPGWIKGQSCSRQRLDALARRLGVETCLSRKPAALSIGQRQRVAILRALVHGPSLVLADEPTAAVDRSRARIILEDMQRLARDEGAAVIMVTHDVDLIRERADAFYSFELHQASEHAMLSVCRPVDRGSL